MRRLGAVLVVALGACAPSGDGPSGAAVTEMALAGTMEDLPAHAPSRFGFGAEASEERVALWDIDVKPDGEEQVSRKKVHCRQDQPGSHQPELIPQDVQSGGARDEEAVGEMTNGEQ